MPNALTGNQIIQKALLLSAVDGYEVSSVYALEYINDALEELVTLHDEVGKKKTQAYNIDRDNVSTWLELPDDFLKEKRTYDSDNQSRLINAIEQPYYYMIENEQIRFDFEGNYIMEYIPEPEEMTSLTETPNVHPLYHRAMAYYCSYRIKAEIFGDEETEKDEMYAMFMNKVKKAAGRLNGRKNRRIMQAPRWG